MAGRGGRDRDRAQAPGSYQVTDRRGYGLNSGTALPNRLPPVDRSGYVSEEALAVAAGRDTGQRGRGGYQQEPAPIPGGLAGSKLRFDQNAQQPDMEFWAQVFGMLPAFNTQSQQQPSPWYGYGSPWGYGGGQQQQGAGFGLGPGGGNTPMFGYGYGGPSSNIWY